MDARDVTILKAIADSGDPSPKRIEEETGIPKSTIHYRLQRLRDDGVVVDDLFTIDLAKFGLGITVITDVLADYDAGYHARIGDKLGDIDGVEQVYFTMGDTDFVVISHLPDQRAVERLIVDFEHVEEIERTSSKFVIATIKDGTNALGSYSLEKLLDVGTVDHE